MHALLRDFVESDVDRGQQQFESKTRAIVAVELRAQKQELVRATKHVFQ